MFVGKILAFGYKPDPDHTLKYAERAEYIVRASQLGTFADLIVSPAVHGAREAQWGIPELFVGESTGDVYDAMALYLSDRISSGVVRDAGLNPNDFYFVCAMAESHCGRVSLGSMVSDRRVRLVANGDVPPEGW